MVWCLENPVRGCKAPFEDTYHKWNECSKQKPRSTSDKESCHVAFLLCGPLLCMSLVGFGAVDRASAASPAVAGGQDGVNVGKNSLSPGQARMWDWPDRVHYSNSHAVAGIRG